jgi:hypothetical protein
MRVANIEAVLLILVLLTRVCGAVAIQQDLMVQLIN